MKGVTVWIALAAWALAATSTEGRLRYHTCKPCQGDECDEEPSESCEYGVVKDPCGRWVCARGPTQPCGGRENHLGSCGPGLRCECNVCTGCSAERLQYGLLDCYTSATPMC